ncbi:LCP family protein [Arcanobacterium phocisimile]|nr:LCP family protein [Arcanobacterium phocisimile]
MTQPPSFEPRKRRPRPHAQGARPVGRPSSSASQTRPTSRPTGSESHQSSAHARDQRSAASQARAPRGPIRRSAFRDPQSRAEHAPTPMPEGSTSHGAMPPSVPPQPSHERATNRQATPVRLPRTAGDSPRPRASVPSPHSPSGNTEPNPHRATRRSWQYYAKASAIVVALFVFATVGWGYYLYDLGDSQMSRTSALTGRPPTPGTTYLIVGSDERGGVVDDPTEGHRADTIMVLHVPDSGTTSLTSIPRDSLVDYPDGDAGKINASFNIDGAHSLVATVENLSGLTVDHYVQIGMDGVKQLTDAVGGVNLCLDYDVDDPYSTLVWEAGCHDVDGTTALAFSRMRYQDPLGDIGRTARQRQVVSKIISKAASTSTFFNPGKQRQLVESAAAVLTADTSDSLLDVAWAGLALRNAMGPDGLMGAPPISSLNYVGYDGASYVLLDEDTIDNFWAEVRDGTVTNDSFASF